MPQATTEMDVEGMISRFLRADPDMVAAVDTRVYTDLPHERVYPLVLVQRSGGPPVTGFTLSKATCTISVFGGRHVEAQQLTSLVLRVLQALRGPQPEGAVSNITTESTTYTPDPDSPDQAGHARPRYVSEITVTCHP
jgi:hypothetical protein